MLANFTIFIYKNLQAGHGLRGLYLFIRDGVAARIRRFRLYTRIHFPGKSCRSSFISPFFHGVYGPELLYIFFPFSFLFFPPLSFSILLLKHEDVRWKLSIVIVRLFSRRFDFFTNTKFEICHNASILFRVECKISYFLSFHIRWQIIFYRNHALFLIISPKLVSIVKILNLNRELIEF